MVRVRCVVLSFATLATIASCAAPSIEVTPEAVEDYEGPGVMAAEPVIPTDATRIVAVRYKMFINSNQAAAMNYGKILFSARTLYNPDDCPNGSCGEAGYQVESNVQTSRVADSPDGICQTTSTPPPADTIRGQMGESGFWIGAPEDQTLRLKGRVGLRPHNTGAFPRFNQWQDGVSQLSKAEAFGSPNVTKKELHVTFFTRGETFTNDLEDWGRDCMGPLTSGVLYQRWYADVEIDSDIYHFDFAYPQKTSKYIYHRRANSFVTEFYEFPGIFQVFVWDQEFMREGGAWERVTQVRATPKIIGVDPVGWGVRVANFRGMPTLEFSSDGSDTYPQGTILDLAAGAPTTLPVANWAETSARVNEDAGAPTMTLNLSRPADQNVTITYRVSGSAQFGADHSLTDGTITIPQGASSGTLSIPIVNDSTHYESDEIVQLTLMKSSGATIGEQSVLAVTISDVDKLDVDTLAPNAPVLTHIGASCRTAILLWTPVKDKGGSLISHYEVWRGNQMIGTARENTDYTLGTPEIRFVDVIAGTETFYLSPAYTVVAVDGAGNRAASAPRTIPYGGCPADTLAPTVTLRAPSASPARAVVPANSALRVVADATDDQGILRVDISVDAGAPMASLTTWPFITTIDTRTISDGLHDLKATAYDAFGKSTTTSMRLHFDSLAPAAPTNVTISESAAGVLLQWSPSDDNGGSGVRSYRIWKNGALWSTTSVTSFTNTLRADGQARCYAVSALDRMSQESSRSTPVCLTTIPADPTPTPTVTPTPTPRPSPTPTPTPRPKNRGRGHNRLTNELQMDVGCGCALLSARPQGNSAAATLTLGGILTLLWRRKKSA